MTVDGMQTKPDGAATFRRICAESYRKAGGDVKRGTQIFIDRVMANPTLLWNMAAEGVAQAGSGAMREMNLRERARIMAAAKAGPSGMTPKRAMSAGVVNAGLLLDFPLAGGQRLRTAKRPDVRRQIQIYDQQIAGTSKNRAFLIAVEAELPEGKTVGELFTEERLQKLFKSINEVAG